jgi:hypothetical protein
MIELVKVVSFKLAAYLFADIDTVVTRSTYRAPVGSFALHANCLYRPNQHPSPTIFICQVLHNPLRQRRTADIAQGIPLVFSFL